MSGLRSGALLTVAVPNRMIWAAHGGGGLPSEEKAGVSVSGAPAIVLARATLLSPAMLSSGLPSQPKDYALVVTLGRGGLVVGWILWSALADVGSGANSPTA